MKKTTNSIQKNTKPQKFLQSVFKTSLPKLKKEFVKPKYN